MNTFIRQHEQNIHGVLAGFDRVHFRGTLRSISFADGLFKYLCFLKVLLVAFTAFFDGTSRKLKVATERLAKTTAPGKVVYLAGTRDKQEVIEALILKHKIPKEFTGLIAGVIGDNYFFRSATISPSPQLPNMLFRPKRPSPLC